eukprot:gene20227-24216_t
MSIFCEYGDVAVATAHKTNFDLHLNPTAQQVDGEGWNSGRQGGEQEEVLNVERMTHTACADLKDPARRDRCLAATAKRTAAIKAKTAREKEMEATIALEDAKAEADSILADAVHTKMQLQKEIEALQEKSRAMKEDLAQEDSVI